jgi:dihydropteroate synthase
MSVTLCGILNVTPDSFSDGSKYQSAGDAYDAALQMIDNGAQMIDIGGDSTRPNSKCAGAEEEWRRIAPLVKRLSPLTAVSVDTHHAEVARRALNEGALIINDISSGNDPLMFEVVAEQNASIVLMFSSCPAPHVFTDQRFTGGIERIKNYLTEKAQNSEKSGIDAAKIFVDPGMGRFISSDYQDSMMIAEQIKEIAALEYPLFIGASRKGFLKPYDQKNIDLLDRASAEFALGMLKKAGNDKKIVFRVHNVLIHYKLLINLS